MFDCWTTIGLLVAVCIAIYHYAVRNNDHWARKGIAFVKPVPFFGNMANTIFKTRSFAEVFLVCTFIVGSNSRSYDIGLLLGSVQWAETSQIRRTVRIHQAHNDGHRSWAHSWYVRQELWFLPRQKGYCEWRVSCSSIMYKISLSILFSLKNSTFLLPGAETVINISKAIK